MSRYYKRSGSGPDRDAVIAAIIETGARLHGPGHAPYRRGWEKHRPDGMPGASGAYRVVMGKRHYTGDNPRSRPLAAKQWTELIVALGLRYPPRTAKRRPKEFEPDDTPNMRAHEDVAPGIATQAPTERWVYHPARRKRIFVRIAACI